MASTIKSTTQTHIDIEDIIDNLIILKDGSCSLVLQTNAINFGLLSEEEQDATIYAYAAFLNSLTFSIQILIRSDVKDISGYLRQLDEQEIKQTNPAKRGQIVNYKQFISSLITERNVLEKKFYIAIPFSTLELGVTQSMTSSFVTKSKLPFEKSFIVQKAKANLESKKDHVLRQLARIGLSARELNTQELIQLVFSMYNPSSSQGQKIANTADYTVPLVQPAYINPKEATMADNSQNMPNQPSPTSPGPAPAPGAPAPLSPEPTTPDPVTPTPPPAGPTPTPPSSPTAPASPISDTPTTPDVSATDMQNTINSAASDLTSATTPTPTNQK